MTALTDAAASDSQFSKRHLLWLRSIALFWHSFVLVLSIAVLVLVIDPKSILVHCFRDSIEFDGHPSQHRDDPRQPGLQFETRFPNQTAIDREHGDEALTLSEKYQTHLRVFNRKPIDVKSITVKQVVCHCCLCSSTSTASLSTSTTIAFECQNDCGNRCCRD